MLVIVLIFALGPCNGALSAGADCACGVGRHVQLNTLLLLLI